MTKTAILINTRERPTQLAMLLQSIRTQTYQDFDIFILDDNSGKPMNSFHYLKCMFTRLNQEGKLFLKRTKFNHGVSRARQKIVDWAMEGDYKYFLRLDDDVVLEPDYIERLKKVLENPIDPERNATGEHYDIASGVTIPMVNPTFRRDPKYLGKKINRVILDKEGNFIFNGDDCGMGYTESKILPADHFRSCALIKREVHEKVKYYPTKLSKHGFREEQIFSFKALMKGFKIGVDTKAENYHQLTPSGGERFNESNKLIKYNQSVLEDFTKKHKELIELFPNKPKIHPHELNKSTNLAK